jgi:hypothetical protein
MDQAEKDGRITAVPYDPQYPVYTAWDLGWSDPTGAWFFQLVGYEVRVLEYHEAPRSTPTDLATMLKERPYHYGGHAWPHDADSKMQTAGGRSFADQMRDLGIVGMVVPRELSLADDRNPMSGINLSRALIARCVFDRDKTKVGRQYLREYREDYDERNRVSRGRPVHDYTSHAASAWRQIPLALHRGMGKATSLVTAPVRRAASGSIA